MKSLVNKVAFSNPTKLKYTCISTGDNMTMKKTGYKVTDTLMSTFSTLATLESFWKSRCLFNNFLKGKGERGKFWEMRCTLYLSWIRRNKRIIHSELFGGPGFCSKEAIIEKTGLGSDSFMWPGLYFSIRKNIRELFPFKGMLWNTLDRVLAFWTGKLWTKKLYCTESVNWVCPEAHWLGSF